MRKTSDSSKSASMVFIATGILLLVGTAITFIIMVPKIDDQYRIQGIDLTSYIFILGGVGVVVIRSYRHLVDLIQI